MNKRLKLVHFSLAILISIFVPLLSAYLDYSDLVDVDFPTRDRSFENPEQTNLLFAQQDEPKLCAAAFDCTTLRPGIDFLGQISHFPLLRHLSEQETTILRC